MMSKKPNLLKKSFEYTPTQVLPPLKKVKTSWDLAKLYYKSEKDPQVEADIALTEKTYLAFANKWSKKAFTENSVTLKQALTEYETISALPFISRPGRYFAFRSVLNAKDTVAHKHEAKLRQRLRQVQNKLVFFTLAIGKIPKKTQKAYLKDQTLQHFHYYLDRAFKGAAHHLSEAEEKIINLKSAQSYGMWVDMVERITANRTLTFKGQTIAIPEAIETLDTYKSKDRQKLWSKILIEMAQIGEVAEHEFTAIISDVRTEENLRGYKKPYSSAILGYQDNEASVENLIEVVSTKGFALSKKFYRLKAQYHGVKALHYTQKYDSLGEDLSIPFPEAVTICRDVFYGVNKIYGEVFDTMLTGGQIDVYPKPGKRGGAFMSGEVGQPTQVFLNHTDNFKSLETLAHEMGHAIHAQRSKTQSPLYESHSITTAETASTLFENLLFDAVYAQAPDHKKIILLHDRITRDIATIQRQIAFFNCELEIHQTIEREGVMTNEELCACMTKHLRSYLGPAVSVQPEDGYSYVYVSHLRYGFYVYTYTFGILMSTIMANNYQKDHTYAEKIDHFLTAGESTDVASIFKSIGIDTTHKDTFLNALKNHEADIEAFAGLVKSKK